MPKLAADNIVEITLPSGTPDDPAIVKLNTTITTKQALSAADVEGNAAMLGLIASMITDWNFTDESGQPVPITEETVGRLELEDFKAISDTVGESIDSALQQKNVGPDEKKA